MHFALNCKGATDPTHGEQDAQTPIRAGIGRDTVADASRQNSASRRHPPGDGSRQCAVPGGVQYAEPSAFPALYTEDAVLFFHGIPPITGPQAIKQFWESQIKLGVRDHTYDIIETGADGTYAYQVTKNTVQLVRDTGERTLIAGHSVRIFEKQSDGTWKIKIHMFNRLNSAN